MGDAVADLEDPNQDHAGIVDVSSHSIDTAPSSELKQTAPEPSGLTPPSGSRGLHRMDPRPKAVPQLADGSLDFGDDQRSTRQPAPLHAKAASATLWCSKTSCYSTAEGKEPISIDTLTFTDDGIGVTRTRGDGTRILALVVGRVPCGRSVEWGDRPGMVGRPGTQSQAIRMTET